MTCVPAALNAPAASSMYLKRPNRSTVWIVPCELIKIRQFPIPSTKGVIWVDGKVGSQTYLKKV